MSLRECNGERSRLFKIIKTGSGLLLCFCHMAFAETCSDITTHIPMAFSRPHLPWYNSSSGTTSCFLDGLDFSLPFLQPWPFPLELSTHLSYVVIYLILFCSLYIGYGQPYSLSWLRLSGNFSTKFQAHVHSRAQVAPPCPLDLSSRVNPQTELYPPTLFPRPPPSLGPLSLPHRSNSGLAFCSSLLTGYLAQVFLLFLEWSFAKSSDFVTPKLYSLLVTHSDQAAFKVSS